MTTALATYKAWELKSLSMQDIKEGTRESQALAPDQVRIAVKAVSLNFREQLIAKGLYAPNLPLPVVPCSDGAGEVVEVGSKVTRFKVGDRVSPNFMPEWIDGDVTPEAAKGALGAFVDGMLRQFAVFSESALVHIPAYLSYEEAATLPCAALTAWSSLMVNGNLKAGQTVLIQGTGGVSIFALQLAKIAGAKVIATTSSDVKAAKLKELGAAHVINYKTTPKWEKAVLEATGGAGVDHVVEVGGAGTLERSMKSAKLNGHVSVIGVLDGVIGDFSPLNLIMKSLKVQGVFVGSRTRFEDMNRALELHQVRPVIDKTFKFDQIVEALAYMESGKHFGKIVLTV
ncbi:MAG: NAD(P)-dependent alcohol dehydrogenase [Candidatus Obscuribacter sp.]|nr:NAD(P)-dependent alcohol dehydrogenase [Candidatus Obscuribacter sp.]